MVISKIILKSNLEWSSAKDNLKHAELLNLRNTLGENSPLAKISEATVRKICKLLVIKYKLKDILTNINDPNLTLSMLKNIKQRRRWKSVSKDYLF